jgi:DNA-binding NtrC family response regulator
MAKAKEPTTSLQTFTSATSSDLRLEPCASLLFFHRDGSQIIPLHEGQSVVVGRARPADVPINDPSLSRQHARFSLVNNELWVEDLNSTNGTRFKGKKISRSRIMEMDEVQLGAVSVVYHVLVPDFPTYQGMESHDRLVAKMEQELERSREFHRQMAVLMVRAARRKQGHLGRWAPRVRALLRSVDAMAVYDSSSVLICQVETDADQVQVLAQGIIKGRVKGEPQLLCGIAVYPDHAGSVDELVETVRTVARQATGRQPIQMAGAVGEVASDASAGAPVVVSPKMQEIYGTIQRIADSNLPVLICGETGSGKEVLAQAIHDKSGRRKRALRCINCASIPEQLIESALFGHEKGSFTGADRRAMGLFEVASGGTVLLDEIGELSPPAQAKILRVLETKRVNRVGGSKDIEVDVRVLAATHQDLEQMCEAGRFRWDLFYRLNGMALKLPPLRDRPEEILPLAEHFMREAAKANRCNVRQIDEAAQKLLTSYGWPGNVRELRNVMERAVVIAQEATITVHDLSERVRQKLPDSPSAGADLFDPGVTQQEGFGNLKDRVQQYEAHLLLEALKAHDWNQTNTAKALGIPLRTFVHKMKVHGLKKRYEND